MASSTQTAGAARVHSVDVLRGLALILFALDMVRGFTSADHVYNPLDLDHTTLGLYFTRWITHFCAPAFLLLAGVSAQLRLKAGESKRDLSWFLATRGAFLIALEFLVVGFLWDFQPNPLPLFFQVIWALGASMLVLAALIHLPLRAILAISLIAIFGHNLLDAGNAFQNVNFGDGWWGQLLWGLVHKETVVCTELCTRTWSDRYLAFIAYPLVPWVFVMALGFVLGRVFSWGAAERRKALVLAGVGALALFVVLRAFNVYGDPAPWTPQGSALWSALSFLNVEKYPPSLLYLLVTLGPTLALLAALERASGWWSRAVAVFGQASIFFFMLALFFSHVLAIVIGVGQGFDAKHFLQGWWRFDPGFGVGLTWVYVAWVMVVVVLYPICEWYADLKVRKGNRFLSYL
jgi:uncharacterized membrane protein